MVVYLKLPCKILKGIEGVGGIEPLVVLSVATFHLTIVPGGIRADYLVLDAMLL